MMYITKQYFSSIITMTSSFKRTVQDHEVMGYYEKIVSFFFKEEHEIVKDILHTYQITKYNGHYDK